MNDVEVIVNGNSSIVEKGLTISQFLLLKGLNPETVIVECNGEIVKKETYFQVVLQDKDCLEVMNFVGGG